MMHHLRICRYGNRVSFQTSNSQFWKILLLTAFGYAVTQIFGPTDFSWTSNLGNISLLFACTVLVQLVQDDLTLAKNYIEFLEKSNKAFDNRESEIEKNDDYLQVDVIDSDSGDIEMVDSLRPPLQVKVSLGTVYPNAVDSDIALVTPTSSDHMRQMKRHKPTFDLETHSHLESKSNGNRNQESSLEEASQEIEQMNPVEHTV